MQQFTEIRQFCILLATTWKNQKPSHLRNTNPFSRSPTWATWHHTIEQPFGNRFIISCQRDTHKILSFGSRSHPREMPVSSVNQKSAGAHRILHPGEGHLRPGQPRLFPTPACGGCVPRGEICVLLSVSHNIRSSPRQPTLSPYYTLGNSTLPGVGGISGPAGRTNSEMGLKVVLTSRDWFFGSFHVSSPVRPVSFSGLRDPRPRGSWARFSFLTTAQAGSRVRKSGSRDTSVFVHGSPRAEEKTPDFASRTRVQPRSVRSLLADSATPVRGGRLGVPVVPGHVLASLQVSRLVRGSGSRVPATPPFSATGALARRQKHQILPPERVSSHVPSGHF